MSAADSTRSAEEIAREMVTGVDLEDRYGWFATMDDDGNDRALMCMTGIVVDDIEIDRRVAKEDAVRWLSRLIEQSRAEVEAGAREHVEAIDHYREGLIRIWRGEADPRSVAADYIGEDPPEQPRDLAGRIRALSTRWFNAWASLGTMDHQTDAALRMCLDVLRQADRSARGCPEQMTCPEFVGVLREWATNAHEATRPVFVKVADELEVIVRECEEKR